MKKEFENQTNCFGNKTDFIEVENGALFNVGNYCYTEQLKVGDYRPNGVPMRGQWIEYILSITPTEETYLTSLYTEVIKSNL